MLRSAWGLKAMTIDVDQLAGDTADRIMDRIQYARGIIKAHLVEEIKSALAKAIQSVPPPYGYRVAADHQHEAMHAPPQSVKALDMRPGSVIDWRDIETYARITPQQAREQFMIYGSCVAIVGADAEDGCADVGPRVIQWHR